MVAFGEAIERLRAPLIADDYSGQATARDWTNPDSVTLAGFAIDPGGSHLAMTVNREQITTTPTMYGPFGADVLAGDRVRLRGRTWDVTGHRADWRNPYTGREAGASWPLQAVEG